MTSPATEPPARPQGEATGSTRGARPPWRLGLRLAAIFVLALAAVFIARGGWDDWRFHRSGVVPGPGQSEIGARRIVQAEITLRQARTANDLRRVVLIARRTLREDPLEHRALRVLAEVSSVVGLRDQALDLMEAAARRTERDPAPHAWLADEYVRRGRPLEAIRHVDALLYQPAVAAQPLLDFLTAMLERPDTRAELGRVLAGDPSWRSRFFRRASQTSDPQQMVDLYLDQIERRATLDPQEAGWLLDRLVAQGRYEQAYLIWVELAGASGPKLASVNNGGFELDPSRAPFDWRLFGRSEIAEGDEGGRVLEAAANAAGPLARQLLLLPAGSYELHARQRSDDRTVESTLVWTLRCMDLKPTAVLGATVPAAASADWTEVTARFDVPAAGCPAQQLTLLAAPTLARGTGRVQFDDVRVDRIDPVRSVGG